MRGIHGQINVTSIVQENEDKAFPHMIAVTYNRHLNDQLSYEEQVGRVRSIGESRLSYGELAPTVKLMQRRLEQEGYEKVEGGRKNNESARQIHR